MKYIHAKKCPVSFFIILALATAEVNAQPAFVKDSLENYIKQGMTDWNIPGLAIAIVKDGKAVVMKGFGVRNLQTNEPVDENTLFMIASNSKFFTATALAKLDGEKKLSLDDHITKFFPDFKMYDSSVTGMVNIRDMLSHHQGTKTFQGDFTFWNSSISRREIMYKMRFLKPSQNFRQSYGYCNSCFLTAGEIIPVVTGKPWEVYVHDEITSALDMTRTTTLGTGMSQMENAASPYSNTYSEGYTTLPYDNIDNLAPAGSMLSSVKDLSLWLMMQLDSGRYNGKQIIPWQALRKTRQMQTILSSEKGARINSHFIGYCLGVLVADYNGKQVYWHTGGADGFVTNTCFVPEEKLGITILTNNDNQEFFELLRLQILDAYLDMPYRNRSKLALPEHNTERKEMLDQLAAFKKRLAGNTPPLPLASYAGIYENTLYGNISISVNANKLLVKFPGHAGLTALMQYMDNDEWIISYSNPVFGIFPIKFTSEGDAVKSVDIKVNDFIEYDAYKFIRK